MELINETPLKAAWLPGKIRPPSHSATILVKGTFELRPDAPAVPAPKPLLPTGDENEDEDHEKLLRYPSDFALFKPGADLIVQATAHAPGRKATDVLRVAFGVGSFSKALAVIGDRVLRRGLLGRKATDPKPFTSMELTYYRAFGGPEFAMNPLGTGHADEISETGETFRRLPNIEDPARLITDWDGKNPPAGFGPIPMMWPQRRSRAGSYDKKWQKERWPYFPADFDWRFFNSAPPDQQLSGYLRGDEEIWFENLHSKHPRLKSRLPGLRVRAFVVELVKTTETFREVPLVLDTLIAEPETGKLVLVWRGNRDVRSEKLYGLYYLYVAAEPLAEEPKSVDQHRMEFERILNGRKAEAQKFEAQPAGAPPAPPELPGELAEPPEMDTSAAEAEAAKAEADAIAAVEKKGRKVPTTPPKPPTPEELLKDVQSTVDFATKKLTAVGRPVPPELLELGAALPGLLAPEPPEEIPPDLTAEGEEAPTAEPAPTGKEDVRKRAERRESFDGEDLTGADLSGLDLSGLSFKQTILARATLRGSNLAGTDLTAAVLSGANLSEVKAAGAKMAGADLAGASLEGTDLSGAILDGAEMIRAHLRGAKLAGASAAGTLLTSADLSGADLTGAVLTEANLSGARLHGTTLSGADLTGAVLQKCWGRAVKAEKAVLVKVKGAGARFPEGSFADAKADGSIWEGGHLYRADFSRARLDGAEFSAAYLEGARFDRASLKGSRFVEGILRRGRFVRANLFRTNLEKADLSSADFSEANLYEAEFLDSRREDTNFQGANLKMTKLGGGVR